MFSIANLLDVRKENISLLARIYFIFFVFGMMSTVLGAILPSLGDEYGLSQTLRGTLLSAHQLGNLIAVFASGVLPYAIGRKLNTVLLGSFAALGLAVITLTGNPLILLPAFLLTGIGRGTMSNITNVVVGENAGNKAAGLNLLHGVFAIGAFLSPFMVIAFMSIGWRTEPLVIMLVMVIALILIATSKLSSHRSRRAKGESAIPSTFTFWINTFIMFFYLCCEASMMGWLVTYFGSLGYSPAFSTAMQSLLWIMMLLGRLSCAIIAGKVNKSRLILFLGSMLLIFFFLLISPVNTALKVIAVLGAGLSMSGIYPTTLSTMDKSYNSSTSATGICIGTASIGAIIMPIIIGHCSDSIGISAGFSSIGVPVMIMVVLMIWKARRDAHSHRCGQL